MGCYIILSLDVSIVTPIRHIEKNKWLNNILNLFPRYSETTKTRATKNQIRSKKDRIICKKFINLKTAGTGRPSQAKLQDLRQCRIRKLPGTTNDPFTFVFRKWHIHKR